MATNKVTTNVIDMSGNTGGLVWAKGTSAQRPTGVAGDLRLNTTDSRLEYKDNADWKRFSEGAASPSVDFQSNVLAIAGGGGGGDESSSTGAGGGGAGGFLENTTFGLALSTNYTVTVGSGGALNTQGDNSVFSTLTAVGGGRAGYRGTGDPATFETGGNGGSGGGAASIVGRAGGTATAGQGFDGGTGSQGANFPSTYKGGGGGGASEAGNTNGNGHGGDGKSSSITGVATTYAGGGGAAAGSGTSTLPGGSGGGGDEGDAGTANTGGGGGARNTGGSGIVIVRYPNTYTITVGAGLTSSTATDGSDKVTTFTAGTDTISFS